jgi:hypothetical protein
MAVKLIRSSHRHFLALRERVPLQRIIAPTDLPRCT